MATMRAQLRELDELLAAPLALDGAGWRLVVVTDKLKEKLQAAVEAGKRFAMPKGMELQLQLQLPAHAVHVVPNVDGIGDAESVARSLHVCSSCSTPPWCLVPLWFQIASNAVARCHSALSQASVFVCFGCWA